MLKALLAAAALLAVPQATNLNPNWTMPTVQQCSSIGQISKGSDWYPIGQAPKDGTMIQAVDLTGVPVNETLHWSKMESRWTDGRSAISGEDCVFWSISAQGWTAS